MGSSAVWQAAKVLVIAASLAALSVAPARAETRLTTAGGFVFDIDETKGGQIIDGTDDAFDGAYLLEVNGRVYDTARGISTFSRDGRTLVLPERLISGATVHREIYVPATGGNFVRYLDVVQNQGDTPLHLQIAIRGNVGSDAETVTFGASDAVSPTDSWFGSDDLDESGDPAVAHVVQGDCPLSPAVTMGMSSDAFRWQYETVIDPGGQIALLTFGVQARTRAEASAQAATLAELEGGALAGIETMVEAILNYSASPADAPRICFSGPTIVDEGAPLVIGAEIRDADGVRWEWDTDDDGEYGELPDEATLAIGAGETDGDSARRVWVRAFDGEHVVARSRLVLVRNVAPTIVSSPRPMTSIGARYRYEIVAEDPGSAHERLTYHLLRGIDGMSLDASGVITWSPESGHVTEREGDEIEPYRVAVLVEDGDGGHDVQEWTVRVSPNVAPDDPMALYPSGGIAIYDAMPRLVVKNAADPDLDALTYHFEIDTDPLFRSANGRRSPWLAQGEGFTAWQLEYPLPPGQWFWRVVTSDGTVETQPIMATFHVLRDPNAPVDLHDYEAPLGPALRRRPPDNGSCSVGGSAGMTQLGWIALALAALIRRKKTG